MITLIVFLPLAAAILAGLRNARFGSTAARSYTTGALFVSCALSWPIFLGFIAGTETSQLHHVLTWIHSGDLASIGRCASTR
jgi:NADH-quinone oxidoreductase subunit L